MKRELIVVTLLCCLILLLLSGSKIFSHEMFSFHDLTQAARISEFTLALENGQVPPRMSHNLSFGMGYPIFNYYAPTAYWITSGIHLLGFSIPVAIKASFLFSLLTLAIGMYVLLRGYFSAHISVMGAFLLASSPFIALEIFVRGNLAEMWFLALLPVVLVMVRKVSQDPRPLSFVALVILFSAFITSHNALSILGFAIVMIFAYEHTHRKVTFLACAWGTILSSYFLVPAFAELGLTYAKEIASHTDYMDHFVCVRQLWGSAWGFGGSIPGCIDGMSFMVGKSLLLVAMIGGILYAYTVFKNKLFVKTLLTSHVFFGALAFFGIFLSIKYSLFVWYIGEPLLKLFQFPWRFLGIGIIGLAFFAAYAISTIKNKWLQYACVILVIGLTFYINVGYFIPNPQKTWSKEEFEKKFLSQEFIRDEVVFRVPEYIPKTVDYQKWLTLQEKNELVYDTVITPLDGGSVNEKSENISTYDVRTSSKLFLVNKHYLPHWSIKVDGKAIVPDDFDSYGRPKISIISKENFSQVSISYIQTPIEKVSNMMTLASIIMLVCMVHPKIWQKLSH